MKHLSPISMYETLSVETQALNHSRQKVLNPDPWPWRRRANWMSWETSQILRNCQLTVFLKEWFRKEQITHTKVSKELDNLRSAFWSTRHPTSLPAPHILPKDSVGPWRSRSAGVRHIRIRPKLHTFLKSELRLLDLLDLQPPHI